MAKKKATPGELSLDPNSAHGANKEAAVRCERVSSIFEKQAEKRFERLFVRLIWRLGLVSQKDVRELGQRIEKLEHRLGVRHPAPHPRSAARKPSAVSSRGRRLTVIG
jgi:hypothetical protein